MTGSARTHQTPLASLWRLWLSSICIWTSGPQHKFTMCSFTVYKNSPAGLNTYRRPQTQTPSWLRWAPPQNLSLARDIQPPIRVLAAGSVSRHADTLIAVFGRGLRLKFAKNYFSLPYAEMSAAKRQSHLPPTSERPRARCGLRGQSHRRRFGPVRTSVIPEPANPGTWLRWLLAGKERARSGF